MNKIIISVMALIVLIGGTYFLTHRVPTAIETIVPEEITTTTTPATTTDVVNETTSESVSVVTFTMSDIAKHNSSTSCYTTIRNFVYDLTLWIKEHPGGARAILSICGKDGTATFGNQHGGSAQQETILATFKIGELAR